MFLCSSVRLFVLLFEYVFLILVVGRGQGEGGFCFTVEGLQFGSTYRVEDILGFWGSAVLVCRFQGTMGGWAMAPAVHGFDLFSPRTYPGLYLEPWGTGAMASSKKDWFWFKSFQKGCFLAHRCGVVWRLLKRAKRTLKRLLRMARGFVVWVLSFAGNLCSRASTLG